MRIPVEAHGGLCHGGWVFYIKLLFILIWFLVTSFLGTLYAVVRWGNLNINRDYGRFFSWGVLKILGIRIEVEGREYLEARQPAIYIANHQGNLDMATLASVYPKKTIVIGKKELLWLPFFGVFFVAAGNICIDRKKTVKAVAGLFQAVQVIRNKGASIWIFPEGTRNRSGEGLLPFKRGAFHMAFQAGVPVVAIVSSPLTQWVSWKDRRIQPGVMRLRVLPPFETTHLRETDIERFSKDVRERMLEAMSRLAG